MKYIGSAVIISAAAYLEVNGSTDAAMVFFMAGLVMAIFGGDK